MSDPHRLERIRTHVSKVHAHHGETIERGGFLKVKGSFLTDLLYLVDEVLVYAECGDRIADPDKFQMVRRRIVELYENHTEQIDGDKHLTVAGCLLNEAMFLVDEAARLEKTAPA